MKRCPAGKRKIRGRCVKPYIDTMDGRAQYMKTEVENAYGNWNDNYYISRGEYVIHEGQKHHVYVVKRK